MSLSSLILGMTLSIPSGSSSFYSSSPMISHANAEYRNSLVLRLVLVSYLKISGIGIGIGIFFENLWYWNWYWYLFFKNTSICIGIGIEFANLKY